MAEIEPASDEIVAAANAGVRHGIDFPHENLAAILARLRKAETDNANMARLLSGYRQICSEAGIAPASSEIYAAAERLTERAEKAEAELDRLEAAIEEAANHDPEIADYIRAYTQGGGNG